MLRHKLSTRPHKLLIIIVCLLILAGLLVGCLLYRHGHNNMSAGGPNLTPSPASDTGLVISRENSLNQPGVSDFTLAVSHSSAVILLDDIKRLKSVPGSPDAIYNCPEDDGVEYTLQFSAPDLMFTADATGCAWIHVNQRTYFTTDSFWRDIKNATHKAIDPDTNDCKFESDALYCNDN